MTYSKIIERYIPFVDFIAEIIGDNCEVALHDFSNPDSSIVAIRNGHLSGRHIGGPATDLALKILQDPINGQKNYIANYKAYGKDNKPFRSFSYFIKDDSNNVVGMLCVNIIIDQYLQVMELMKKLSFIANDNALSQSEKLHENVEDVLHTMINHTFTDVGVAPERMSLDERLNVIKALNEKGAFLLKNGVTEVAKSLKVSEPTVYRYLSKFK